MAYVAVDKNGDEHIYATKPERSDNAAYPIWVTRNISYVKLPKGIIESLLHRKMTWEEEPINLEDLWASTFNKDNFEKIIKPRSKESIRKAHVRKLKRLISEAYDIVKNES